VKRGEIWTVAGGPDYAGKPRPAIVIQGDKFDATPSVTICLLTGEQVDNVHARFAIAPTEQNGLRVRSQAMVDKIGTIPRSKAGYRIGQLDRDDIAKLNTAITLFLGLADPGPD
jgi:mRNA interferase MazF